MTIAKSDVQPGEPRASRLARYPLTFTFIIALGGTWIVWSLFVLSQDGAGLMPFRSPMSFMPIMFLGARFSGRPWRRLL
jgi:hypothetical protein